MAYERVNWENLPSTKTPINQTNLNKMENGIDQAGAEIFVGAEEPTAGEKVWFNKDENSIYVRNSNGVYEEFIKKPEEVYSTEEQRIGTWIDGKPLYEKVIVQKDISISNAVTINTNILNKNELVECNGLFRDGSNKIDIPYPLVSDDGKILQMYVSKDGTQIGFRGSLSYSRNANRFHIFILKYTKTTD